MTHLKNIVTHSTDKFTWSPEIGLFYAQEADLDPLPFDDAGFKIKNPRTGRSVHMKLNDMAYEDDSAELISYEFVCVTPGHKNLKARIYSR